MLPLDRPKEFRQLSSTVAVFHQLSSSHNAAGEVTAGLAETNGSLTPGLWLRAPAD